ncbi:hypothetical protein FRC07_008692 [Ceratobasidium sp. 392]|nr:hypothetical protein FRC07_008692 [Ceratobasidium sp. 392]
MLCTGSVLAVLFILVEWRLALLPVLPLSLFRVRNILIIYATTFLTGIVYYCNLYFLPSYYTDARGFTPVQAGIYLLPLVLSQSIAGSSSGQFLSRTRYPKPYIVAGYSVWCIGAGLQTMFDLNTSKGLMVGFLILEGVGIGFTLQTTLVAAQASAAPNDRAVITGSRNFFRTLGGAIGLVVCTATKNAILKKELRSIPAITPEIVAAIIKSGPQVLANSDLEGAVRAAYMSSLHAVFILFIPITGLSVVASFFLKSVYLEGDKDVLPVTKTPTPPASQENIELNDVAERPVANPLAMNTAAAEKLGLSSRIHLHPADVSPTRLSVNTVVFTEPQLNFRASVAAALGISRAASEYGLVVKHFKITVVGSRRITGQSTPPDQVNWVSMWAWTIAKRDDYKHLESLHLDFDPPLDVNYPTEQQHIIERAMDFGLSKLTYAVMGSPEVQWRRHVERRVDSASNQLPDWTPRPNLGGCKVYTWWLRESGIGLAKVPEDAFHGVITRLRGIMLTRWDDKLVPSVESLQMSLRYRLVEGESERVREQWASYGARTA